MKTNSRYNGLTIEMINKHAKTELEKARADRVQNDVFYTGNYR